MLEAWRDKPFTEEEMENFSTSALLGSACQVQVVHNGEWTNVKTVMALPEGVAVPEATLSPISFDMDNDDVVPDGVPRWIQNVIKKSQEVQEGTRKLTFPEEEGGEEEPEPGKAPF